MMITKELFARRSFLGSILAAGAIYAVASSRAIADATAPPKFLDIEKFSDAGKSLGIVRIPQVVKSLDEWRHQLSPAAFHVAREEGTEFAFSGEYDTNHSSGLYRCVCCGTALFDSTTKFDSGTGWPSFWKPISPHNVVASRDSSLAMVRTAVSCHLCEAHLGHVFDDGPPPTGLRYCMNSVAMHFIARASG